MGRQSTHCWLWSAVVRKTNTVLVYVFGRKDEVFRKLRELSRPFGIQKLGTNNKGVQECNIDENEHMVDKRNTQKIAHTNLNFMVD